ncbi:MAG: ABC transporter ATP-binding protein [Planctomycetaceae bacterium]|nr:ABC transporter ATP-binding protein [Planctomycetaceae bacterium]
MKNFFRALNQTRKHWPSLTASAACSLIVAALWGANIGAFFPILEVTIRGQSALEWVETEIEKHQSEVTRLSQQKEEAEVDQLGPENLAAIQQEIDIHKAQEASFLKMKPWIEAYVPRDPFHTICWIVGFLIISTLIKHLFLISSELLVGRVSIDVSCNLRNQIFEKALHMDRISFENYGHANFMTTTVHTTEMLSSGLMMTMGAALREPLKIISCVIGACYICWRLMVLSCLVAPLVAVMLYFTTRALKGISQSVLERATGFHHVLHESLSNIQTVQAFQGEKAEQERFEKSTNLVRIFGLRFIFYSSLSKPIIEFLGVSMLGISIVSGAYLVLNQQDSILGIQISDGQLGVSSLLVFFGMLIGISDPLRKLSTVYSSIYTGTVAADHLFRLLDQSSQIQDPESPIQIPKPHQKITLDSLGFHYLPNNKVLQGVSLEIPYGSTVAIIGANGSGKSTLINLLCRFYDPTEGGIQLDEVDYRQMTIDEIRSRIALVNQHTQLFNETVRFNIKYGHPEATDEEMMAASQAAHADEFINTVLHNGYDTNVGQNGSRLSGGQRQRVALARALLRDPEILILDEATSQIDMQSEELIRQSLAEHKGERTMIIITHREKLLELADEIYQLDHGVLSPVDVPFRKAA